MNNKVKCPSCGNDIEINDALAHQLKEETERIKKAVEEDARKKIQNEFEEKEKERNKLLEAEKQKNKELVETIAAAEKNKRREEEKIREEVAEAAAEKHRLEKLEWEKTKADMQKTVETLQRQGKQGSQQLQGEVLELDLEGQLKSNFPNDEFLPIPKGVEGGDIWQKVMESGDEVGSILWETKRAKTWDKKWLPKLRANTAKVNGSESILVSQILPPDVKGFHLIDRVWVSNYEYALHTARIVRFLLRRVAVAKKSTSHTDDDLRKIREYINSDNFKHKISMHYDVIKAMREELDSEVRLTQVRWKRREEQIKSLNVNFSQLEGEINLMVDKTSELPQIAGESDNDK
ncbi:MAG: hypothetical protein A2776_02770 [Candidatus Levybacteria bacterium RIFCSPHIGHO2_01_FULL_40_10]|nr:MAG: hypothetical protein A2776_02770 [Candidatus Levybacteria bacterium RIFCSPHIGHO2_01_FULL_40_10]